MPAKKPALHTPVSPTKKAVTDAAIPPTKQALKNVANQVPRSQRPKTIPGPKKK